MDKRTIKKLNLSVSLLGMGCMRLPEKDGKIDYDSAQEMIDVCMAGGVNFYDTAYIYHGGESEKFIKKALVERYDRDTFLLTDKLPLWLVNSMDDVERIFNEQLERTGAGYFDFYLLHGLETTGSWQKSKKIGIRRFLEQKKAEGLIRNIAFSTHDTPEGLKEILEDCPDWAFVLIQLNYYDWFGKVRARECYEELAAREIPCVVMEPVMGGGLADPVPQVAEMLRESFPGDSFAKTALRFVGGLPGMMTVLSGMTTLEQVKENLATMTNLKPFSEDEQAAIERVYNVLKDRSGVPCTSCNYCDCCPNGVQIPKVFAAYNSFVRFNNPGSFLWMFNYEIPEDKRAKGCSQCGECEEVCPQKINIMDELIRIEQEYKKLG